MPEDQPALSPARLRRSPPLVTGANQNGHRAVGDAMERVRGVFRAGNGAVQAIDDALQLIGGALQPIGGALECVGGTLQSGDRMLELVGDCRSALLTRRRLAGGNVPPRGGSEGSPGLQPVSGGLRAGAAQAISQRQRECRVPSSKFRVPSSAPRSGFTISAGAS